MIDWKTIKDLHVIKKLEEIIGVWFGVDIYYADVHGNLQNELAHNDYKFHNFFLQNFMTLACGKEYIQEDVANGIEHLKSTQNEFVSIESNIKGLEFVGSKIIIDDEIIGYVFAYPYVKETFSTWDTINKFLVDAGSTKENADLACTKVKKLSHKDESYLYELVTLVANEISTFHEEISKREDRIQLLNSELVNKYRYHSMIGKSRPMQKIYQTLEKIKKSESSILIQGSNGTGKELIAKAIHYGSPRKDHVFVAQNCSAFNDNLLDSELFGHVKGSFTGAIKDKKGLFEVANGGTLFLDEIGDTSLSMQVKLLRVLQEGTFLPVGATKPVKVNVRVIAATNKPLKEMIAKGEFREDLYYRINVINVALPMLHERGEDIPLLMDHFLNKKCAEMNVPLKTIAKKTLEKIFDYHWPGNVRELENEIERLVVLSGDDKVITPDLLSSRIYEDDSVPSDLQGVNTQGKLKDALEELEKLMIGEGLKRCNFNKSKLAKELGISRAGLIMKVEKYGLDKRKKVS